MIQKALIATDLSEASDSILECQQGLHSLGIREVILLHVLYVHVYYPVAYDTEEALRQLAAPKLNEQIERLRAMGFSASADMAVGRPARVITQYAEQQGVDLIVVGTHGGSLERDLLLGSVAYEVVHRATKPVLLFRQRIVEGADGRNRCEAVCGILLADVLHPTDFSDVAEEAFSHVQQIAASGQGRIRLLHVQDSVKLTPHLTDRLAEFNRIDLARLERLRDRLVASGATEVAVEVAFGSPAAEIIQRASDGSTSLIVMGSQGRGFVGELFFGSVAHNVLRHAPVPVMLVPPPRPQP